MMLESPEVANIDCNDCVKWTYDLEKGERIEYDAGGVMLPIARVDPPPCSSCPKGEMDLDNAKRLHKRNWQSLKIYREIKATRGSVRVPPHLEQCSIFSENMLIIENEYRLSENDKIKKASNG
jgi:hypothetical protein